MSAALSIHPTMFAYSQISYSQTLLNTVALRLLTIVTHWQVLVAYTGRSASTTPDLGLRYIHFTCLALHVKLAKPVS